MSIEKDQAFKFIKNMLEVSPLNTSKVYVEIDLKKSKCKLYIPIVQKNVEKAKQIHDYIQRIANEAEL